MPGKEAEIAAKAGGAAPPPRGDNRRTTGGEPPDNFDTPARDGAGRFVAGNTAGAAMRFRLGRSGNPAGRPRRSGRFRSGARAAAALLDAKAEHITEKAVELELAGDAVAVRFCLGRLLGVRRGQPVELALPEIAAPRDLSAAIAAITGAVTAGRITPDEALSLSQMLDGLPRVLAAARADMPSEQDDGDDPQLIDELDRIADRETLRQSQALATIPGSGGAARLIETASGPLAQS